jgi:hypothetical protein
MPSHAAYKAEAKEKAKKRTEPVKKRKAAGGAGGPLLTDPRLLAVCCATNIHEEPGCERT